MDALPALTEATYARRTAAVRSLMESRGLDALIVYGLGGDANANVNFLAGPIQPNALLFYPRDGDALVFVQPKALVPFVNRVARCEARNGGFDYISEVIDQHSAANHLDGGAIGIVEVDSLRTRGIPHLLYQAVRDRFPSLRLDTITEDYEAIRMRFGPEEVAIVAAMASGLDQVMDFFVDAVRPGATPAGVIAATHQHSKERGLPLSSLSCRAAAMDGSSWITDPESTTRSIQPGDYIFFESSARQGSYAAYRGFPIALGDPAADCRTLFDTALEVAKGVAAALKPGGTTEDIIAAGDIALERGHWCHGPLASALGGGGWQMPSLRGFDGYRTPKIVTFEPGMTYQAFPHLMLADNSKICILGNTVTVTENGPRIHGSQGLRYVVK